MDLLPVEQLEKFGLENFINAHGFTLCKKTVKITEIAAFLSFDADQTANINYPPNNFEKNQKLYECIEKMSTAKKFLEALSATRNVPVIDFIRSTLTSGQPDSASTPFLPPSQLQQQQQQQKQQATVPPTAPPPVAGASATIEQNVPEKDGGCLSTEQPSLFLKNADKMWNSKVPKAHALIINIYHYNQAGHTKDVSRPGSEKDVHSLTEMFSSFNIGVYVPDKLKGEDNAGIYVAGLEVIGWVKDFREQVKGAGKSTEQQACFVCIMGHGTNNGLFKDSGHHGISFEKEIFPQFNNALFPSMQNKPKVFFINCCRGNNPSPRVTLAKDNGSGGSQPTTTLPHVADFLIFWSTTPENFSTRDELDGSKFVQELCKFLKKHHTQLSRGFGDTYKVAYWKEIETILKEVANEMRTYTFTDKDDPDGKQHSQTPNIDNRIFGWFWWRIDDFQYSQIRI